MSNQAATFTEESIPQINKVLKFVLENPYSDFYRRKYKGLGIKEIKSYEDFHRIPFLTIDEFLVVPIEKRTFVSPEEIKYYSFSSGTTNHRIPNIVPHSSFGHEDFIKYYFNEKKIAALGVNRLMLLASPSSPAFMKYLTIPRKSIVMIPGDSNNMGRMAKFANELKIDAVLATPTRLYFFIEQLIKNNFDLKRIKWVHSGGEFCSEQKFQYFKSKMPNAFINFGFATSETGGPRGYRCEYLANNNKPNVFHPVDNKLVEVIDENDQILPFGKISELIHTDMKTKAFPLIRYKTKDIGSLARRICPCNNNFIITLGGKANFDVMKFSGVTLYTELISNAINIASYQIEPKFQMHVFEERVNRELKPKLQLHIKLKKNSENLKADIYFKKQLAEKISGSLNLSAKFTLKQMVDQNIFLPLEIIFVDAWPEDQVKAKNIISHLN